MCVNKATLMERVLSQLEQINRSNWQIRDALDTISIRQEKAAERNDPRKGPYQAVKVPCYPAPVTITPPGDYVVVEKEQYERMAAAYPCWDTGKLCRITNLIEALNREVVGYPNYRKVGSPLLSALKQHGLLTGPAEKVRIDGTRTGDYKDML